MCYIYLTALKYKPDHIIAISNLGQYHQDRDEYKDALKYFSRVYELDNTDWRALTKMIQETQALGTVESRDQAINDIYSLWKKGGDSLLIERGFYVREQFSHEKGKIFALEYFKPSDGPLAKFVFKLYDRESGDHVLDIRW